VDESVPAFPGAAARVLAKQNRPMSHYTFPAFNKSTRPRYAVLWDLHWRVLECQRLEPATDVSGAMATAIERQWLAARGRHRVWIRIHPTRGRAALAHAEAARSI
jgi:hypothetical protein